jgi:hypothetical protein
MSSWLKLVRDVERGSEGGTDARDAEGDVGAIGWEPSLFESRAESTSFEDEPGRRWLGEESATCGPARD